MNYFGAYILNYLSDDQEVRAIRLATHRKQLDWWIKYTTMPIYVIAMNYQEGDKTINDRITYYDYPAMLIGEARRVQFDHFYASDHKWGVIMDDDAVLYNTEGKHNSANKIFDEMSSHIEDYNKISIFFPHYPRQEGFQARWKKDFKYQSYHVFVKSLELRGSMFMMRNFRLYSEPEIQNDPTYTWGEDLVVSLKTIAEGYNTYKCWNIILKEFDHKASFFPKTKNIRQSNFLICYERIMKEYNHWGLTLYSDRPMIDTRKFMKKFWLLKHPKTLCIAKDGSKNELFDFS